MRKGAASRILAYVLALCMIIGSITWPDITAKAETITLDLKPDTGWQTVTAATDEWSEYGKAEIRFSPTSDLASMKAIADAGYKSIKITYAVDTFTAASGQNAGVMPFASYGSEWKNNDKWVDLSKAGQFETVLDLSAISTTSTEKVALGIQAANLQAGSTIKFRIVSAVLIGTKSSSGGAGDNTGEINTDVEYNYAKLLQESLYLYDANMCGKDVSAKSEFSWRSNCHTEDATATYNGKTVDVSGGYHDAGDHAKFGLPQAYSATVLGIAHMEFAEAFTDTATEAHYKRIMDRFVDYFERCTVLGSDGSVQAFCYQVGDGGVDHGYWGAPEYQTSRSGQAAFTSDSDTCTDIVSETAAALAAYYINYKDKTALSYAEKLFTYADTKAKKNSSGPAAGFYSSDSWEDDYALAAAFLYKATGKSSYATKYNNVYGSRTNPNWALCWNNVAQAALLYSPNSSKKSVFVENQSGLIASKTQSGDNNFCLINSWGSARYNTAHQMTGLLFDKIYSKNDYSSWANGQMKYILGNNAGSKCFVVGYNKYSSKYPHHRAASGYQGSVTGNAYTKQAHVLVGALVGGPASSSTAYVDSSEDYNQNEVALDYNAGLVGAAAGLYLYVKNNGTDEEKAVQKVVPKSEVSPELRTISGESGGSTTTETTTTEEDTKKPSTDASTEVSTDGSTEVSTTEKGTEHLTDDAAVKVTGITFDRASITMKVGDSDEIKAVVTPADATDASLVWSSSDISRVSVQNNGKISALSEGTATITVTARDGSGVTAKCKITVTKKNSSSNVNKPKQTDIRKTAKVTYRTLVNRKNRAVYTGKAIVPKITVKVKGSTLKAGRDYKVKYAANKNIGKAKVIITGAGKYKGTVVKYFSITTAKGKIYKVGDHRYKITNPALNGKGTVMLMSVSGKTTVRVPDTVRIGGKKFKVTSIRAGAFKNNREIKKVIIGRNVSVIGSRAFYGCKNLKSVTIRGSRLSMRTVGRSAFARMYAKCVIRVPSSKVKLYKKILIKRGVSRTAVIKK